jgi:cysteine desulfurase
MAVVYLDYAATTPVLPEVLDIMLEVYRYNYGNAGSRSHLPGQSANGAVEKARRQIAAVLQVQKSDVIFTSGATEANNIALLGLAQWGKANGRQHIISTQIEHKAVLEPLEYLRRQGFDVDLVPVGHDGRVCAKDVIGRLRNDTLLVSVMHANNETGVIQPVEEIGEAIADTAAYFHVDAAQTFGKLVQELRRTRYDLVTASSHKVYGPQGVGALITRPRNSRRPPLAPLMWGGGQEQGLRPGTLPVALIAGFGMASEVMGASYQEWHKRCRLIKESVVSQLAIVEHAANGSLTHSVPNILNVRFPGVDSEALMLAVKDSLAFSNGSACTSSSYHPSHVLVAMGLTPDQVESSVRFSWGPHQSAIDIGPLVSAVGQLQQ